MAEKNDNMLTKLKKSKGSNREDLLNIDKNDLVDKIMQLEAHNEQLKNIISKSLSKSNDNQVEAQKRKFDFSKCHYRRVLLHILYFGWNYQGLAVQEDSKETIEHSLFQALIRSCLIECREKSQYHRCGRTDKGVSAFGQVMSITLRSNHIPTEQNHPESISTELKYCKMLNRLLPNEIRAIAWIPIPTDKPEFSARFDCKRRQYKYYFPKSSLDITAMRDACRILIGSHDFRHLCKMDVGNGVTEFRREISKAEIDVLDESNTDKATSMCVLTIEGKAFLWHQIRCIMGVLFLVGQRQESSDIVTELLDVNKNPRKPQYQMALDIPLNLFHCSYDVENKWVYDENELKNVIINVQSKWTIQSVKTTMIKDCLQTLETIFDNLLKKREIEDGKNETSEGDRVMAHVDCLLLGVKPRTYTPLLKRLTCSSLEERIKYYTKKRKITNGEEKIQVKDTLTSNNII